MRQLPIRWRILSLAALNAIVVFVFAAVIWDGARVLTDCAQRAAADPRFRTGC